MVFFYEVISVSLPCTSVLFFHCIIRGFVFYTSFITILVDLLLCLWSCTFNVVTLFQFSSCRLTSICIRYDHRPFTLTRVVHLLVMLSCFFIFPTFEVFVLFLRYEVQVFRLYLHRFSCFITLK